MSRNQTSFEKDASANLSTKNRNEERKKTQFEPNICGKTGELMCLCKL